MTETKKPALITVIVVGGLLFYYWLVFSILSQTLHSPVKGIFLELLYPVAGIACSLGLLMYKRWSWYVALIMWIFEGAISFLAVALPTSKFGLGIVMISEDSFAWFTLFLLIAIFRFASLFYLTRREVCRLY